MVKIGLAVLTSVAVLLLLLLVASLYLFKRSKKPHKHVEISSAKNLAAEDMVSSESLQFDLCTLRDATDNFSDENKLGEGGFGPVYKGTLHDGLEIAVKRLSKTSQQGHGEMRNEVVLLAKLQHKNLVRLLGCCIQEEEMLLVYEFLCNKSLDKILFDPARRQELSWWNRYRIIQGIGRGLLYLHEDSRLTVIHRDLKSSNILLDPDMNPKISDFGLAKLFTVDGASVGKASRIAGTLGYMAPEYALHGQFSAKSDVFSYGVIVLEIVVGRSISSRHYSETDEYLLSTVWRHWSCGRVLEMLDGSLADALSSPEVLRCIHVGLLCVQENADHRPTMTTVLNMLTSRSNMEKPSAPPLVFPSSTVSDPATRNEASISELESR